jgi:hypothetical protein
MSVQCCAEASQKFTCPALIVPEAGVTVAVNVTTVPEATLVTEVEPEVSASTVVVLTFPWAAATAEPVSISSTADSPVAFVGKETAGTKERARRAIAPRDQSIPNIKGTPNSQKQVDLNSDAT